MPYSGRCNAPRGERGDDSPSRLNSSRPASLPGPPLALVAQLPLRALKGEQDHVADAGRAGQEHDHAVDADAWQLAARYHVHVGLAGVRPASRPAARPAGAATFFRTRIFQLLRMLGFDPPDRFGEFVQVVVAGREQLAPALAHFVDQRIRRSWRWL